MSLVAQGVNGQAAELSSPRLPKKPTVIVGSCVSPASYLTHADQTPPILPTTAPMARPGVLLTLKSPYVVANSRGELRYRLTTDEFIAVEALKLPSAVAAFSHLPSGMGWRNQPTTVTSKDLDGDGVDECIVCRPGDGEHGGEVVIVQWRNGRWRRRVRDLLPGWDMKGPATVEVSDRRQFMWVITSTGSGEAPEETLSWWHVAPKGVAHGRLSASAWKDPSSRALGKDVTAWVFEGVERHRRPPFQFTVPHYYAWDAKRKTLKEANHWFASHFAVTVIPEMEGAYQAGMRQIESASDPSAAEAGRQHAKWAETFIRQWKQRVKTWAPKG